MNQTDSYSASLGTLYQRIPKAVLAALAVSLTLRTLDPEPLALDDPRITTALLEEWRILHANGIVPHIPPPDLVRQLDRDRAVSSVSAPSSLESYAMPDLTPNEAAAFNEMASPPEF